MKLSAPLNDFSKRLGYTFITPELLIRAMTHRSFVSFDGRDNQRLEFLGDRVLALVIAEALLGQDETAAEGVIAPRFNALVRKETCAAVAQSISLGEAVKVGRSELLTGGRSKMALLADTMEAVIAAVYYDGGFDAARELVLNLWQPHIDGANRDARDAKTRLQEWAQAQGFALPDYTEIERGGPAHAPFFEIEVSLQNGTSARARAPTKKSAQQNAAMLLIESLNL